MAQNGEETAHRIAESEKIATTISSGMASERPMSGRTEIRPVLPMAVATEEQKMIAKARFGRALAAVSAAMDRGLGRRAARRKSQPPSIRN